jgi:circadian clock protein KaiC
MTVIERVLRREPTGINGFDDIAMGGLPQGRSTLVTGTAGSGKSLFAMEFLARGITLFDEPGVFVTFEETPEDIRINAASLDFDIAGWEHEGKWLFVDATMPTIEQAPPVGAFDFSPLIARIEHAVLQIDARRVSLDPLSAILARFANAGIVRAELLRASTELQRLGVTSVLTAEKDNESAAGSRHGVEEFVPANVVTLRNALELGKRRRTIEIVKFRGATHRTGEWLFAIDPGSGLTVISMSQLASRERASQVRISSGNPDLDQMCGGGFFRDALVLLAGPIGAGKTLSSLQFAEAAREAGERCLLYTFDETRDQLGRNAASWGLNLDAMEASGLVQVLAEYPETSSLEDHFLRLRSAIDRFDPARLIIDSLSALERISTPRALVDFVTALGGVLRQREITTLLTASPGYNHHPAGAPSAALEAASVSDVTIHLDYTQSGGRNQRSISVIQSRGSAHDENIRTVTIDDTGLHIGDPVPAAATG